jgi:hypothetical protein
MPLASSGPCSGDQSLSAMRTSREPPGRVVVRSLASQNSQAPFSSGWIRSRYERESVYS